MCKSERARDESLVHVALPLHFKCPNPKAKFGPDEQVSVVTGSQKSGSKPFSCSDNRNSQKGQSFADAFPAIAGNASEPWGCSR